MVARVDAPREGGVSEEPDVMSNRIESEREDSRRQDSIEKPARALLALSQKNKETEREREPGLPDPISITNDTN